MSGRSTTATAHGGAGAMTSRGLPLPANRIADIPPSGTMAVGARVRELRAADHDIIQLAAGSPTPSPQSLKTPFNFDPSMNILGDPAGTAELRASIAQQLRNCDGLAYDPSAEIVVTVGAKQGLHAALLALTDPGDEVAILDPCWVTYGPSISLAGGTPCIFALDRERENRLDAAALAAVISGRTRVIIINTPHNPTGRVFTRNELQEIADLAIEHDLWVISDESFDKFVFDDRQHISASSLSKMRERTIVLRSFSKAYGFVGGRIGYLAAPAPVSSLVRRFNEHVLSCVSPYLQSVALSVLAEEPDWTARLRMSYQHKRDFVVAAVNGMTKLRCATPEGTFYVWVDISDFNASSTEFAEALLHEADVAVTPGNAFGAHGEGFIRLNLAGPMESIEEGLRRLKSFVGRGECR